MVTPFDPWRAAVAATEVAMASHATTDQLGAWRNQRLAALLEAASEGSPHYRRALAGRDSARTQLEDLPIAHKAALMRHFETWVTDPAIDLGELHLFIADPANIARTCLGRYTVWESSGSSGVPAIFVQDARAMAVYDALEALRRPSLRPLQRWWDPWGLADRTAFVGATGGHFASTVSVERLRQLHPALAPRLRCVSFLQPMAQLCRELESFRPTALATYPSAAVLLAEEHLAGRLQVELREVWTGGEVLSPAQRAFLRESFGCPVTQSYGASEFLSLAFECPHGALHLNSDWAILEPVDAQGRAVPDGQPSRTTLLTNLANHIQPLIRYELGDQVTVLPTPCTCGSHLPAIQVSGRDDDTLQLAVGGGRACVKLVPLAVCTVLEDAGLFDFQLVQKGPRELVLTTSLSGERAKHVLDVARERLQAFLRQQGAGNVQIRCSSGTHAHRGRSGKTRRVVVSAR